MVPRAKGGADDWPNIRPICRKCNGLKRDYVAPECIIVEWMQPCHKSSADNEIEGAASILPILTS